MRNRTLKFQLAEKTAMKAEQRLNDNAKTQYREYEEPRIAKLSCILTVVCVMGLALAYLYQKKRKKAMPGKQRQMQFSTEFKSDEK